MVSVGILFTRLFASRVSILAIFTKHLIARPEKAIILANPEKAIILAMSNPEKAIILAKITICRIC